MFKNTYYIFLEKPQKSSLQIFNVFLFLSSFSLFLVWITPSTLTIWTWLANLLRTLNNFTQWWCLRVDPIALASSYIRHDCKLTWSQSQSLLPGSLCGRFHLHSFSHLQDSAEAKTEGTALTCAMKVQPVSFINSLSPVICNNEEMISTLF